MKTFTNRSKNTRTLMRDYDNESGEYEYYWLNAKGERTVRLVLVNGQKYLNRSYYGHEVRAGRMQGRFVLSRQDMSGLDRWSTEVEAGESVRVPARHETYAQCASRTGQFPPIRQYRKSA